MCCRDATPQDLASVLRQAERLHESLSPFITQLCRLADRDPVVQQQVEQYWRIIVTHFCTQMARDNSICYFSRQMAGDVMFQNVTFPLPGKWLEMFQDVTFSVPGKQLEMVQNVTVPVPGWRYFRMLLFLLGANDWRCFRMLLFLLGASDWRCFRMLLFLLGANDRRYFRMLLFLLGPMTGDVSTRSISWHLLRTIGSLWSYIYVG